MRLSTTPWLKENLNRLSPGAGDLEFLEVADDVFARALAGVRDTHPGDSVDFQRDRAVYRVIARRIYQTMKRSSVPIETPKPAAPCLPVTALPPSLIRGAVAWAVTVLLLLFVLVANSFGQNNNPAVVVGVCGTPPANFPNAGGRAYLTVDTTGAICIAGSIELSGADGAIQDGANGSILATVLDLTSSNPLTVAIVDGTGAQISSFGGGTQYTEDASAAANPVGTALNLIRTDTPATQVTTDGDNVAARGTNYGALYTSILGTSGAFIPGTAADGLLVNLGTNNDVTVTGSVTVTDGAGALNVIVDSGSITANAGTNLNTSALVTTTNFTDVFGAASLVTTTQADNLANTTDTLNVGAFLYGFDGSTFDRIPGTAADGLLVNLGANNDVTVTSGTITAITNAVTVTDGAGALNTIVDSGTLTAVTTITNPVTVTDGAGALNVIVDSGAITVSDGAGALNVIVDSITAGDNVIGRVKLSDGTDVADILDLTNNNPLTVAIVDSSGSQITSFGGGTQYTEGDTDASITGTALLFEGAGNTLVAAPGTAADGLLVQVSNLTTDSADNAAFPNTSTEPPVGVGGIYESSLPTYASGDKVTFHFDANGQLLVSGGGGGTQYTEDAAAAANPIGTAVNLVRADTPGTLVSGDGDNVAQRGSNYGAAYVTLLTSAGAFVPTATTGAGNVDSGTQRITLADDGTGRIRLWDGTDTALVSAGGELSVSCGNCSGTGVSHVDDAAFTNGSDDGAPVFAQYDTSPDAIDDGDAGIVRMNSARQLLVEVAAALPAGTNNIGDVDVLSVIPGTGATNLGKAIDTATGSTDTGVLALATRDDALTSLTPADGDNVQLRTTSTGALWVQSATTDAAEDAAVSTNPVPIGGVYRTSSVTLDNGDVGYVTIDADGHLQIDVLSCTGCGGGTQYTEDDAAAGNPVGTATILVRDDTPSSEAADGDNVAARGGAYGNQYVTLLTTAGAAVGTATTGAGNVDSGTQRVTLADDGTGRIRLWDGTDTALVSAGGELAVSCGNCSGTGVSHVDDAAFTPASDDVVPIAGAFDDSSPDSVNEGDAGVVRMSANRNLYSTIRDAAGNERGANVNGSNELLTSAAVTSIAAGDNNIGNVDVVTLPSVTVGTFPDNEPFNLSQVGGNSVNTGTGTAGTGTLRVAIATDANSVKITDGTDTAAVSAGGELSVNCGNCSGTGVSHVDDAAFSAASDDVVPIAGVYQATPDSVDDGDAGAVRMTADRLLLTSTAVSSIAGGTNYIGRVRLTDGADDGDILDLTNSNPVVMALVDGNGDQITSFGGGTQYTEDAAAAANPVGTALNLVRADTPAGIASTDGDNLAARGTNFGALYTTLLDSAGAVVPTASAGSGTINSTTQRMTIATDDPVNDAAVKLDANMVADGAAVGGNPLRIAGKDGSGNQQDIVVTTAGNLHVVTSPETATAWALFSEDVSESNGSSLVIVGSVRRDTPASSANSDTEYSTINTNGQGALWATITPSTTGGWSTFNATSGDGSTACTNSAQSVKGSQGTFGGYEVFNPNSSTAYLVVYNTASGSVTVGTTPPAKVIPIPAGALANYEISNGVQHSTAISIACVSTAAGSGAPSTALDVNINYK